MSLLRTDINGSTIWVDWDHGDDDRDGQTKETAVRTIAHAMELARETK